MEKYIQIYSLSEAMDNETVCACYPHPQKNISGRKNEERMLNAEKEAKEGKCKLLVWRTINKPCEDIAYALAPRDVEQIVAKYNNAKIAMKEYCEHNSPEYNIEYGKALALESVLAMLGFDVDEMRRKYWVGR